MTIAPRKKSPLMFVVFVVLLLVAAGSALYAFLHPGPWVVPEAAKRIANPLNASQADLPGARRLYEDKCAECHGDRGKGDGGKVRAGATENGHQVRLRLCQEFYRASRLKQAAHQNGTDNAAFDAQPQGFGLAIPSAAAPPRPNPLQNPRTMAVSWPGEFQPTRRLTQSCLVPCLSVLPTASPRACFRKTRGTLCAARPSRVRSTLLTSPRNSVRRRPPAAPR